VIRRAAFAQQSPKANACRPSDGGSTLWPQACAPLIGSARNLVGQAFFCQATLDGLLGVVTWPEDVDSRPRRCWLFPAEAGAEASDGEDLPGRRVAWAEIAEQMRVRCFSPVSLWPSPPPWRLVTEISTSCSGQAAILPPDIVVTILTGAASYGLLNTVSWPSG